jgi:uncharacterized membrane protein YfcA
VSDPAFLVLVGGIFFLGGFVKGAIGLGLPTVVIGLLSIMMPPAQAAAMLVIPAIATNIWQMLAGPAFLALLRRMATMMVGVGIGIFATIGLLTGASLWATAALGGVLALYGVLGFFPRRFSVKAAAEPWVSPAIGLINGAVSGTTGVFVVPGVPYLDSLRMDRDTLIQAIGIHAFFCPLILAAALLTRGQLPVDSALTGATALLPAFGGMYVGQLLRKRLHPDVFRRWFFAGLIGLGGYMVVRSLR